MIAANGYSVIDADKLAREVVEPETKGLQMIAETFGDHVITSSELDRQALRTIVFDDSEKLKTLEAITHPLIKCAYRESCLPRRKQIVGVLRGITHFEKNLQDDFKLVIATTCPLRHKFQGLCNATKFLKKRRTR